MLQGGGGRLPIYIGEANRREALNTCETKKYHGMMFLIVFNTDTVEVLFCVIVIKSYNIPVTTYKLFTALQELSLSSILILFYNKMPKLIRI